MGASIMRLLEEYDDDVDVVLVVVEMTVSTFLDGCAAVSSIAAAAAVAVAEMLKYCCPHPFHLN